MSDAPLPFSEWSTGRKVATGLFALCGYVGLACLALYLSGALFLILHKSNPARARFSSIVRYWDRYADDPVQRKKLQFAIAVPAAGLLLVLPAALAASCRQRRPLHGDAQFATPAEISKAGLLKGSAPGIIVGKLDNERYLTLRGQLSVLVVAPTRSGKTLSVVTPNLLTWPDSVVVLDVKGENFARTSGYRGSQGPVYRFSPFDTKGCSHRWNPLLSVRTSRRHRVADLLGIGQSFYPNEVPGSQTEAFFNNQARSLFLALGLMLLETPGLPFTIAEMLRQSGGMGRPVQDYLKRRIEKRRSIGNPFTRECTEELEQLIYMSAGTASGVVATFQAPLTIFKDATVETATSGVDFRLEDVRRKRMSIYVCVTPDQLATAAPLLNLFFSQLVRFNTALLPEQDPSLTHQCLVINDEFAAMGRLSVLTAAAAFLAGYNLRLLTVVQARSQLDALYGENEARTFATNHGVLIVFAPREQRDAEDYSRMLGQYTETATSRGRSRSMGVRASRSVSSNDSDQRRPLLLPQEIKALGRHCSIIAMENCKPIKARKAFYDLDPELDKRAARTPIYVPELDIEGYGKRINRRSAPGGDPGGPASRTGVGGTVDVLDIAFGKVDEPGNAAAPPAPDADDERLHRTRSGLQPPRGR